MPWTHIEKIYEQSLSQKTGRHALPARIAFGTICVKESEKLTDEGAVAAIQKNPYMQYFLGLEEFQREALFASFMMVHFRKQFPVEQVEKVNDFILHLGMAGDMSRVNENDCNDDQTSSAGNSGKSLVSRLFGTLVCSIWCA